MADAKSSKKTSENKKIFDVAKPSDVPAAPTSRPIIVGHGKSLQQDPMMVKEETNPPEQPSKETPILDKPKREVKLDPPTAAKEEIPQEEAPEKTEQPSEELATNSDEAAVEALADAVSIKREQEEALEKEAKARQEIEKLITSKQYFVKIKTPPAKRNLQLVIVLALLVLAGAGWYLLMGPGKELWAKSEPAVVTQAATTPATTQPIQTTTPTSTLNEFFDPNLGVSFKYPAEWGEAKASDNSKITTEKGKRIYIEFSKNSNVVAGMKSKDWVDTLKYESANCKQPGFTVFLLQKTQKDNGLVVTAEKSDSQVYEELTGGLCNDLQIVATKKFTKSKAYTGLEIRYGSKLQDKFDLAQRIEDYKKQPDKYFTKQLRDQITAAIESTKEL